MNETIKTLASRASCRSYRPEPLSREQLEDILTAGLKAPSGMNRQTQRFVVVQDPETISELSRMNAAVMGKNIDPFYGAPDVIVVLVKKEGTYLYDGSLAMGNLLNAAYSMGLGCCWVHRCKEIFESEEGKALLARWGIEEEVEGIGFCILGYPTQEIQTKPVLPGRVFYVD